MFKRLVLTALLAACGLVRAELPEPVAKAAAAHGIPEDAIGLTVMRGNSVLLSHHPERAMAPASVMKIATTVVALEQLGPVFRGRTELLGSGEVVDGVLQGDLLLRGGADMDFNEDALVHMLEKLRLKGVRRIRGDLLLDRQLFQPARMDVGVPPFDESPEAYYNVIPDALLLNNNMLQVEMVSDARSVRAQALPMLHKVAVRADMKLVDAPCARWEDGWRLPGYERNGEQLTVVLRGTFPRNCSKTYAINVLERQDYLERLFRAAWSRLGGEFSGEVREAPASAPAPATTPAMRLLAEHVSRPLPELLRDINKWSDNGLARTLYLSLGSLQSDAALGSRPLEPLPVLAPDGSVAAPLPSAARAEQAIREWMRQHRINDSGMVIDNGSGLSRTERLSPEQLAGFLSAAQKSPWAPEFQASLPIAATDGTMRRRLRDSPAAAHARIKTGTLNGVVAIAGYVTDANGEQCIVVGMVNHERTGNGAGRSITDALIDWVARNAAALKVLP
ncbi:D-alanyl-D-alanine carboxypeptidase/D-alanyl-D-alanine-endopeptidase [Massilia sp. BJB1822]|uniref:D-alanyl-D-alanine carboxypeptidase/D-alanyl-D-alanine endopeptidase n=1 Tax=Massilia sp. BJB1822 TaxID=2744470 RepID=UPI00159383A1|nr:D-alanyl-D-alanine carboxypeptidase/D-alanyl-D-alanine-endopeptidase [Massilia sp. BJB1822]NVD96600.1 D-alanyl-D-alanine carboxypeptidase/D-alanyl-D-alanine-endopeptidase [Massilia sp. BJB1822]